MGQFWRNGGVGLLVFCTGSSALAYAGHTLPTLLNGWDEQFYFAAAHSLVYDEDLDITNDIRHCPRSDRFDPGGDGTYRVLAVNPAGRYLNKFPLGLSLAEALWLVPAAGVRWLATAFGYQSPEPPGFSPVEIAAVCVGMLLLVSIGVQLLYTLLRRISPPSWALFAVYGLAHGVPAYFASHRPRGKPEARASR